MTNRQTIQQYVNNFRRHLSKHLKPGVGAACKVFPAEAAGAVLVFTIGRPIANEDQVAPVSPTVNDALQHIEQSAFGGHLAGFSFRGTNIVAEDKRLIIIKGDDTPEAWSDSEAAADVHRIAYSIGTAQR